MSTPRPQSIRLTCTSGGSNKEYCASLLLSDDGSGWLLLAEYGPIGGRLNRADKITTPVAYEKALREYVKLVRQKQAKGYVIDSAASSDAPAVQTKTEPVVTGILPQLLNPIAEADLDGYFRDDGWCMQQKHDGERLLVKLTAAGSAEGINKKGMARSLLAVLARAVEAIKVPCVLDGEEVGEMYHVFDLLEVGGVDLRGKPYREREENLAALLATLARHSPEAAKYVVGVKSFHDQRSKRWAFSSLRESGREGVVFRAVRSPYSESRPASGGDAMKFKFVTSATVRVKAANLGKRSIAVEMCDGDAWLSVGNITIPPNEAMPAAGAYVECQYLYVARRGGSLYQPVYKGVRDDQDEDDCTIVQLKYKDEAVLAA